MFHKPHIFCLSLLLILNISLYAHVELTYPEGGETLYSGDTITITWVQVQAHDLQNWELYYSADGAETWQVISNNIAPELREYEWVVPDAETTKGRIRVVQNNADTDYEDVSNNIKIVNITGIEDENNDLSVHSLKASPNPFKRNSKFRFTVYNKTHVSLEIYHYNGKKMATLIDGILPPDDYSIDWNPAFTSTETFLVVLSVGNKRNTLKLQQLAYH